MSMPYNNGGALTDKEFYAGVARLLNVTPATVKKYWEMGFNEFIIREIYFKGSCRLPNIGTFSTRKVDEGFSKQTDPNTGEAVVYRVPAREVPIFTPHDTMINDINMQGVTKPYRKRLKANALTQRDYERQIRAESIGAFGSMSAERVEESKANFRKMLNKKKQEKDGES